MMPSLGWLLGIRRKPAFRKESPMRIALNVLGALLVLIGGVWALQGINVIGGSFMTGQTRWLVIGVACVVGGAVMLGWTNRRGL
jgi:hypothetical protein